MRLPSSLCPLQKYHSIRSGFCGLPLYCAPLVCHSSYSEGDHCPLRLSGLPAAHTFFWVIPQRPAPYFTVHSVGCLQPTPSSEWFLKARTYFTLSLGDSSKPAPYFTILSVKCNWSRIQSKKSCTHQDSVKKIFNLFHKFCLRRNFFIKNLETVCLRLSVPLSKIGTRTGASLSSITKDRN